MKSRLPLKTIITVIVLLWDLQGICKPLQVPSFFVNVPEGHFVAVSEPCKSLAEARKNAIFDVARQVLGSISSRYDHRFVFDSSGNPKNPQNSIQDNLSRAASGIVLGVEQNIVKSAYRMDQSDRYIVFILVRYPDSLIAKMRNLSLGSKILATFVSVSKNDTIIRVTEVNGVSVTLTSADIKICKRNRFADMISFFIIQVPKVFSEEYSVELDPVRVCAGSQTVRLRLNEAKSVSDYLLGAKIEHKIDLKGSDEIGRPVSVHLAF
jgi:hypothetical protein